MSSPPRTQLPGNLNQQHQPSMGNNEEPALAPTTDKTGEDHSEDVQQQTSSGSTEVSKSTSSREPDTHCPICHEDFDNKTLVQPCEHAYCLACLKTWLGAVANHDHKCALCRVPMTALHHTFTEDGKYTSETLHEAAELPLWSSEAYVSLTHFVTLLREFQATERARFGAGDFGQVDDPHRASTSFDAFLHTEPFATQFDQVDAVLQTVASNEARNRLNQTMERVSRRTSEMASNMSSFYDDERPMRDFPLAIITELMETAHSVIVASASVGSIGPATSLLRRLYGQILRMENRIIESRLGDSQPLSHGLRYLERPFRVIYVPTRLLNDQARGENGLVTRDFMARFFPGVDLLPWKEETAFGETTELSYFDGYDLYAAGR